MSNSRFKKLIIAACPVRGANGLRVALIPWPDRFIGDMVWMVTDPVCTSIACRIEWFNMTPNSTSQYRCHFACNVQTFRTPAQLNDDSTSSWTQEGPAIGGKSWMREYTRRPEEEPFPIPCLAGSKLDRPARLSYCWRLQKNCSRPTKIAHKILSQWANLLWAKTCSINLLMANQICSRRKMNCTSFKLQSKYGRMTRFLSTHKLLKAKKICSQ